MLKKEGNMARRWFLIDEKVRFVIAGIVNMAIRYLIFVLLGLFFRSAVISSFCLQPGCCLR